MTALGIWIAAGLTLCIYSFLYKDNPLFKFAEHLFVGVSAGYLLTITFHDNFLPHIYKPLKSAMTDGKYAEFIVLVPAFMGIMMFSQFIPKFGWMVRWPFAFMMGYHSGVSMVPGMQADVLAQIRGTIEPFATTNSIWHIVSSTLVVLAVICTLIYFFFSREHKGIVYGLSEIGVMFLMIGFGASFGYTVMSRISILIGRIDFLLSLPFINLLLPVK